MEKFKPFANVRESDHPPVHPTLLALSAVLSLDGDLRGIDPSHPCVKGHAYYNPNAIFPEDLSNLLPSANRWWEPLSKPQLMRFPYCLAYNF